MPAHWTELCISVPRDETAAAEAALEALGALSITLQDDADDPVLEPGPGQTPLWPTVRLRGLFAGDTDRARILAGLRELNAAQRPGNVQFRDVGERDWTRAWMDRFRPMRFGRRLWIVPGGMTAPEAPDAVVIHLDPGLAFGTGTHPTTALCLEWLDAHPPQGAAVIDYGCGSGILAVAAALLGAERILAVDNDPQALAATQENARKNGVGNRIVVAAPDALPEFQADVLLANILAGPLVALAPRFAGLLRSGGSLVLSGILDSQADTVAAAYADAFDMAPPVQREEWVRLDGLRK
jgi:ribosomal protein L11 methyltransferase